MATKVSTEKILNMLSEKTIEHHRLLKRNIDQRRNGMEDLYGQPFIVYGDKNSPASFYISISPDMVYLERFAFKIAIIPYQTTITGGTDSATVTVNNRSLEIENNAIKPNPHNHATEPHTHNLISGKSFVHTTSKKWEVWIAGIDISEYLEEQVSDINNGWLGQKTPIENIYPDKRLNDLTHFYDILDVASVMDAEGRITERDKLLAPEMKLVEIKSDAPFGVQAYLYLKLSHINR